MRRHRVFSFWKEVYSKSLLRQWLERDSNLAVVIIIITDNNNEHTDTTHDVSCTIRCHALENVAHSPGSLSVIAIVVPAGRNNSELAKFCPCGLSVALCCQCRQPRLNQDHSGTWNGHNRSSSSNRHSRRLMVWICKLYGGGVHCFEWHT